MLPERFWVFWKHFIPEEIREASKISSSTEKLASMIYGSLISKLSMLVLTLCSYCGDKNEIWTFSNHLFQREQEHGDWRGLRVSINCYQKQCVSVIIWNKRHLLKQLLTITYTLDKKFFAVASRFSSDRVKICFSTCR